ncbi:hypothetical protein EDD22DRAFT_1053933 [Suillus occidentalis]|nr:hypothetical protein EDD22DRAFT_1053933 [Suillus occidentalis]
MWQPLVAAPEEIIKDYKYDSVILPEFGIGYRILASTILAESAGSGQSARGLYRQTTDSVSKVWGASAGESASGCPENAGRSVNAAIQPAVNSAFPAVPYPAIYPAIFPAINSAVPAVFPAIIPAVNMSLVAASQLPTIPGAILRMSSIGLVVDCTYCGLAVSLTICQSDKNGNGGKPRQGTQSANSSNSSPSCYNTPTFLHLYPCQAHHQQFYQLSPPPPWTQPAPSSFVPPSNMKQLRRKGSPCEGDFCRKPRALRCTRRMCLKHCVSKGGCAIHSQVSKDCENMDGTDRDQDFEFAQLDYIFNNDGNGLDELQQALQVSMAAQPSVPLHIPSIHELMGPVLSGPAASQQVTAPLQAPLEFPSMTQPPSAAQPARKQPRITNQLDPTWARDLRAQAQQEIEEGRTAERRKEMERGAKQRFVLNWFDADDEPVNMQWVSHCPFFPQYQLADDATLVESLGTGIERVFTAQCCSGGTPKKTRIWYPMNISTLPHRTLIHNSQSLQLLFRLMEMSIPVESKEYSTAQSVAGQGYTSRGSLDTFENPAACRAERQGHFFVGQVQIRADVICLTDGDRLIVFRGVDAEDLVREEPCEPKNAPDSGKMYRVQSGVERYAVIIITSYLLIALIMALRRHRACC